MPILVVMLLVQVYCAYHVISTNRDKYWLFLIFIAPGIGCLIYFLTQILPDANNSRTAKTIKASAVKTLDPEREYREAVRAFDMLESLENRFRLADALISLGRYGEAKQHLAECAHGAYAHDPHILMRIATVELETGNPAEALKALDLLQEKNPGFHHQGGHLTYSRALEALGQTDDAIASYRDLAAYATGEEARLRLGMLLQASGHNEEARTIFDEVVMRVNRGTSHYRKSQSKWYNLARSERAKI